MFFQKLPDKPPRPDESIMPPGHERWYAFEEMRCALPPIQGQALLFLRNHLVMVQVSRYIALITGLGLALIANLAVISGLGIGIHPCILCGSPWLSALVCAWIVSCVYIQPAYAVMTEIVQTDASLLTLLQQASVDDPVLVPALERLTRQLRAKS